MHLDWNAELHDQLDWHWTNQLRPRLDGLTDEEYYWEPVPGCWTIHRESDDGTLTIDWSYPPPDPEPVTTIAWRLGHLIVGVFGLRNASHFDGPRTDYETHPYAATAEQALYQLDQAYARWSAGVRSLGDEGLARPCGPAEGPYAERPMASLVLHINREAIHHGAELALLRDLWAQREPVSP
ncbi:DinB family protein [Nonomuraea sp. NN258]|uniref:DinB family protein n=1 Tax=Nonomuraea antri TaxID=2730852 RepID=UPI0015691D67|nr:DinB family protein [Nonomuraea antri]NRQ38833.1 DinB family protein [Nonomuraea antri]